MAPCKDTRGGMKNNDGDGKVRWPLSREAETFMGASLLICQPYNRHLSGCDTLCPKGRKCHRNWEKISRLCLGPRSHEEDQAYRAQVSSLVSCPLIDAPDVKAVLASCHAGQLSGTVLKGCQLLAECGMRGWAIMLSLTGLCSTLAGNFGLESDELYGYFIDERMTKQAWSNQAAAVSAQARALVAEAKENTARLNRAVADGEPVPEGMTALTSLARQAADAGLVEAEKARASWKDVKRALQNATQAGSHATSLTKTHAAARNAATVQQTSMQLRSAAEALYIAYYKLLLSAHKFLAACVESLEMAGVALPGNTTSNCARRHVDAIEKLLKLYDVVQQARLNAVLHGRDLYEARLALAEATMMVAAAEEDVARRSLKRVRARLNPNAPQDGSVVKDLAKVASKQLESRQAYHLQQRFEVAWFRAVGDLGQNPIPDATLPIWMSSGVYAPVRSWICRAPRLADRSLADWLRFAMSKAARSLAAKKARQEACETHFEDYGEADGGLDILEVAMRDRLLSDLVDRMGVETAIVNLGRYQRGLGQKERDALAMECRAISGVPNPQDLRRARRKLATWMSRDYFLLRMAEDPLSYGALILRRINGLDHRQSIPGVERLEELRSIVEECCTGNSFRLKDRMAAVAGKTLHEAGADSWRRALYTDSDEMNQAVAALHEWFYGPSCLGLATEVGAADAIEGLAFYLKMLDGAQTAALVSYLCAASVRRESMSNGLVDAVLATLSAWIGRDMMLTRCNALPRLCALGVKTGSSTLDDILDFARAVSTSSSETLSSKYQLSEQDAQFLRRHRVAFLEIATGISVLFPGDGQARAQPVYDKFPALTTHPDLRFHSASFGVPDHALAILIMAGRIAGPDMWREVSRLDPTQQSEAIEWLRSELNVRSDGRCRTTLRRPGS